MPEVASESRPFFLYLTGDIYVDPDFREPHWCRWNGVLQGSREVGCHFLAVVCGQSGEANDRYVLGLIDPDAFDGVLAWQGGSMPSLEGDSFIAARFGSRPFVGVSAEFGSLPAVLVENRGGVKKLVDHLRTVHGKRAIGFVRGPEQNAYGQERFEGYLEALVEAGLPRREELISPPGPWWGTHGADFVASLFDRSLVPGRDWDALACANDRIAATVLAALRHRGVKVPDEVAITGFNNLDDALMAFPSITSVQPPFTEQARKAVHLLQEAWEGRPIPSRTRLPSVPVIHQSCGCRHGFPVDPTQVCPRLASETQFRDAVVRRLDLLKDDLPLLFRERESRGATAPASQFLSACADWLPPYSLPLDADVQAFIQHWAEIFESDTRQGLIEVFHRMGRLMARDDHERLHLETLVGTLRDHTAGHDRRSLLMHRRVELRTREQLQDFDARLAGVRSISELAPLMCQTLPMLGIEAAWLVLFDSPVDTTKPDVPDEAILGAAFQHQACVDLPEGGLRFPSRQLLPGGLLPWLTANPASVILHPVRYGSQGYGYVLFQVGKRFANNYSLIAERLANTLTSLRLMSQIDHAQKQLIETEKLAALGGMMAGLAHEINNPIFVAMLAASLLEEEAKLGPQASEQRLLETAQAVQQNLSRAVDLIRSFKQVVIDQSNGDLRHFDLVAYIKDIITSLTPQLVRGRHTIALESPAEILIHSLPGSYGQIFTNLVMNSIVHGFTDRTGGTITIRIEAQGERLSLLYADNGRGMAPDVLARVFTPFFTTRAGRGGSGLGTSIIRSIAQDRLGGTVRCESAPEQGTRFLFDLLKDLPIPDETGLA